MKNWKQQKTTHLSWGCRNTTKERCSQTSHAGDTWGWLEPQQGLPVGAGFTKGASCSERTYCPKDTATPRNCRLRRKNFRNTPASLLLNPSRIHQCFLQAKPIWKPKPETTYRKCRQNRKDKRVRTGSWCKQAMAGTINSRRIKESRVNLSHTDSSSGIINGLLPEFYKGQRNLKTQWS